MAKTTHRQAHEARIAALIAQLSSLANFMFADGREAFDLLTDDSKRNLRVMFDALTDELQELTTHEITEASND